ncbi:hypothetical protein [Streptomyces halobius]|uniref:Uncharacterized protein n=1 Tax=Streptomyces halobius TaxID=2879846 RepID=A0ABY4MAE8_9ACTN|nr:hypothetical protein [Streptomyces halobius]UQA93385.1 hypothetical protein K9S39_17400 [Streptomyces halobius]
MTTVTEAADAPRRTPQARGGISRSVRDSLVVAKRNLIRMLRIPNRARPSQLGFNSGARRSAAWKEQEK